LYKAVLPLIDILGLKLVYNDLDNNANAISICNLLLTQIPCKRLCKVCLNKANYKALKGTAAADMLLDSLRALEQRVVHCSICREVRHYACCYRVLHN
jgi:hypothetical protein